MSFIDNVIGAISPKAGYERLRYKAQMQLMDAQVRRHEGAGEGRRHSGWLSKSNQSVNQTVNKDLKLLVLRSRELSINNPYAKKAPVTIANNVVGTGIVPTPLLYKKDSSGLIFPMENADELKKKIEQAFRIWAEEKNCDFNEDYNFYGLQHLAMRTVIVSGEVLAIRKSVKAEQNAIGLQIQLLEGDYIDTSINTDKDKDGGYTLYGVKFNKEGKRSGYFIFDRHPSEGSAKSNFIDIKDVAHLYDVERSGQTRGVPVASSTILKQRDVDDYEDAELLGKKTSACMPIFVQNNAPEGGNQSREEIESVEPGMIQYLNPGETVSFASPPASNGFSEFIRTQHRAISNGYFLTYEQFTGDLSNVNFSSGRMGWIEFQRQVEFWQYQMMVPKFCDIIFKWFAERFIALYQSGSQDIIVKASWTAPRREMIDPVKEIGALRLQARAGLISWQEAIRQLGYNPETVLAEMKQDQDQTEQLKLMPDWSQYFEKMALIALQKANNKTDSKQNGAV